MNLTPALLSVLLVAQSPAQQQRPKETSWQKILRISGISAMPTTQKGLPGDLGGDLWLAILDGRSRLRLTRDGGYKSPVFSSDGGEVLALREGKLMRVSTVGFLDPPEPLFAVPGVIRLVGFDSEAPGKIVVLTRTAKGETNLGLLDLASHEVRLLRLEAPEAEYRDAISKLESWDRTWQIGESPRTTSLEVRTVGRGSDIFLLRSATPIDVSRCNGDQCGQVALSADGRRVVFVRIPVSGHP